MEVKDSMRFMEKRWRWQTKRHIDYRTIISFPHNFIRILKSRKIRWNFSGPLINSDFVIISYSKIFYCLQI